LNRVWRRFWLSNSEDKVEEKYVSVLIYKEHLNVLTLFKEYMIWIHTDLHLTLGFAIYKSLVTDYL
jgi:hypothetical protein